MQSAGIIDPQSKACKISDLDTMFKATNFDVKKNRYNTIHELSRSEFIEVLIRIAKAKFGSNKMDVGIDALCGIMCENLGEASVDDRTQWRKENLIVEETDNVLRQWERKLYSVYANKMSKDVGKVRNRWTLKIWDKFINDAKLIDEQFTIQISKLAYHFAKMDVVDEHKHIIRYQTMSWLEFIESLARIVQFKKMPAKERIEMVGKNDVCEYYDWLIEKGITHQEHMLREPMECDEEGAEQDPFAWQLDQLIRLIFRNLKLDGQTFSEMRPPDDASKNGGRR